MIAPLKQSHIIQNNTPLPPGWLRFRATGPLDDRPIAPGLLCAGPGRALHKRLIATVDQAKAVVLLASFLLADKGLTEALLRAAARGVRVYALNWSEQRLSRATEADGDFDQRMIEEHKAMLDQLATNVLLRSAGHFHAKFLVTDPRGDSRGWISTANFNRALVDGVELGVELNHDEARTLAAWFNVAFWCEAEKELTEKGRLAAVGTPPAQPLPPKGDVIPVTLKNCTSLRGAVGDLLAGAKRELMVSCYGLDESHAVVHALAASAMRGVRVTVLTRPRPACSTAIQRLREAGVTVLGHENLHAKAIWSDGHGLVMTANLAEEGLDRGFEVGVRLTGERAEWLREILQAWSARFPWRFESSPANSSEAVEYCAAELPLKDGTQKIVEERIERLPPILARDALKLEEAKRPDFTKIQQATSKVLSRRIKVEWEVRPPQLPPNAKEQKREQLTTRADKDGKPIESKELVSYEPPVFLAGSELLVLLRNESEREATRKLAAELKARIVIK